VDGQKERTFGNTCWDNWIGPDKKRICLEQLIPRHFIAARGGRTNKAVNPRSFTLFNLGTRSADGENCAALKRYIEEAIHGGSWLIFTFHGVGKQAHSLFIEEQEHRQLVEWLAANRTHIWTAPLKEVVSHLLKFRES